MFEIQVGAKTKFKYKLQRLITTERIYLCLMPSILNIISPMHLQTLKLLCPPVKEGMHLQEHTLYTDPHFQRKMFQGCNFN